MTTKSARSRQSPYIAAVLGLTVTIAFVTFPEASFTASWEGLELWFDVVLPALFPFFTMAEILMGLGVIHAIGVLLEPLMRPVFRIPGVGGFAVAMGLASGYPLGAKISGRIRRDGLCNREEGERLIAFANTADPLFMVGAVAIGMFALPQVGLPIAVSHYVAAIIVGFLMRYHAGGAISKQPISTARTRGNRSLISRALGELVEARNRDGRPFGELFGDAVKESMSSMLFIGGCIMIFSVLLRVLSLAGVLGALTMPLEYIFSLIGIAKELVPAILQGTMEITIGTQVAGAAEAGLLERCIIASAVIGWSGFSVHSQVAAMVHGTDIRLAPYLLARFTHGLLAALVTWFLFEPLGGAALSVQAAVVNLGIPSMPPLWITWASMATIGVVTLALFIAISFVMHFFQKGRIVFFKVRKKRR